MACFGLLERAVSHDAGTRVRESVTTLLDGIFNCKPLTQRSLNLRTLGAAEQTMQTQF